MAIIGIDQSLTGTGVAHVENDGTLFETKLLKVGKLRGIERLDFITSEICKFIDSVSERIVVAREGYSFGSTGRATFSLGELGGCIDLRLYSQKPGDIVAYYTIPPTVIKKYCLGKGNIKKDSAYLLTVYNKIGVEFTDDNQADAYMIALTLLGFLMGRNDKMTDFFEGLSIEKKEALVSSKINKKGSGVTKSTLKNMNHEEFAKYVGETLDEFRVFGDEV